MPVKTAVYVIKAIKGSNPEQLPVKIGVAVNVRTRLASIQNYSPLKLVVVGGVLCPDREQAENVEGVAHNRLKSARQWGEWFLIDPAEALQIIRDVADSLKIVWEPTSGVMRQSRLLSAAERQRRLEQKLKNSNRPRGLRVFKKAQFKDLLDDELIWQKFRLT